ncbi:MAG: glycosyl transferase, group 1 [Acidobacteriaceae bacterium]|nr:glycosyl transferase, group 1 [Acidobacteriaceae bacterium]
MRIALIAPPFIPIPPPQYGGTELFIAQLAVGLKENGIDVVVYANGESTTPVELRWLYEKSDWPIRGEVSDNMKDSNHTAWAVRDAMDSCDLIHVNNASGLTFSRFSKLPFVYTLHHPLEPALSEFYRFFPEANFVCISNHQCQAQKLPGARVIHHGLDVSRYKLRKRKHDYLSFIGRIAPVKGTHLAIEVAKKSGIPLKIAGQVQPAFKDYFEAEIKPHIDGKFIEFIGEADLAAKNELLGNSLAMLFPIQWDEPFGFVMVEAMACGTPVLALPGGSVPEIVQDGISGHVCKNVEEMVRRASAMRDGDTIPPTIIREFVEKNFSVKAMVSAYIDLYTRLIPLKAKKTAVASGPSLSGPESAVA